MHDYEAEGLHLVYPCLVLLAEFGNGRPLVLAPEQLSLIWVFHWTVKVDCLMTICHSHCYVLLQALVSYQRGGGVGSSEKNENHIRYQGAPLAWSWFLIEIFSFSSCGRWKNSRARRESSSGSSGVTYELMSR